MALACQPILKMKLGLFRSYEALAPATESIAYDLNADGIPDFNRVLDRSRDTLGRESGWQLKNGATIESAVTYNFDTTAASATLPARQDPSPMLINPTAWASSTASPARPAVPFRGNRQ
jgi:hypothetical protein